MKKYMPTVIIIAVFSIFVILSCGGSSINRDLFTIEELNGVRFIRNHAPQYSSFNPELEFLGKIGDRDSELEEHILWDPVDTARLPNGDILVLEGEGSSIKRYNQNYEYISSYGQKGQGPDDLLYPYFLRLSDNGDKIFVAGDLIKILSSNLNYENSFRPARFPINSSIEQRYKRSGMAVLSDSRIILPNNFDDWIDTGEEKLFAVYNKEGSIIKYFGSGRPYENKALTVKANTFSFTRDNADHIYAAFNHQNRIDKYTHDGQLIVSFDRPLPYEIKNEMGTIEFSSGNIVREFPWPSVTYTSKGIHVDCKNRIWVLTFLKQPDDSRGFYKEDNITECYRFDVFDSSGILLFTAAVPNVAFDNFSLYGDRIYLIDFQNESCVYEYRIVD